MSNHKHIQWEVVKPNALLQTTTVKGKEAIFIRSSLKSGYKKEKKRGTKMPTVFLAYKCPLVARVTSEGFGQSIPIRF